MKHSEFLNHLNCLSHKKQSSITEALVDDPIEDRSKAKAPGDVGERVVKAAYDSTVGKYMDYAKQEMDKKSQTDIKAEERIDRELSEFEKIEDLLKQGKISPQDASQMTKTHTQRMKKNQEEDKVQNWLETGEKAGNELFKLSTDVLTYTTAWPVAAAAKVGKGLTDLAKSAGWVDTLQSSEDNLSSGTGQITQGVALGAVGGAIRYAKPLASKVGQATTSTVEKVGSTTIGKPVVDTAKKVVDTVSDVAGKVTDKVSSAVPQAVKNKTSDLAKRTSELVNKANQKLPYDPAGAALGGYLGDVTAPDNAGIPERLGRILGGMVIGGKVAPAFIKPLEAGFKSSGVGRAVTSAEKIADQGVAMAKNIHNMPMDTVNAVVRDTLKRSGSQTTPRTSSVPRDLRAQSAAEQDATLGTETAELAKRNAAIEARIREKAQEAQRNASIEARQRELNRQNPPEEQP